MNLIEEETRPVVSVFNIFKKVQNVTYSLIFITCVNLLSLITLTSFTQMEMLPGLTLCSSSFHF